MKTTTIAQPIIGKTDYEVITNYLKSAESRTLFNRYDVEDLSTELKKAKIISDNEMPGDVVRLNSVITIKDEQNNKVMDLTLVTPKQANIKEKKVSVMSPVGIALIGFRKGQRVVWRVPLGEKSFYILDVK